jgi:tetratricopeptide (TPR) repeat protein
VSRSAPATSVARIETLCDLGRFDEAAREAGRYLRTAPHDVRALCLMSWAQLGIGNPAEALRAAGAAAAAAPFDEWPHRLASTALLRLGRPLEAVAAAEAACRADPHGALPRVQLAEVVRAHGIDLPLARRAADEAVALDPHLVDAHLAVGSVALAQRRRDDADAAFRAALRLDPESADAHHELARLQLSGPMDATGGQLGAAASGFATSLRADPMAGQGRSGFERVVTEVVARSNLFVLLAGVWGVVFGIDPDAPRAASSVPLALLVVPVLFVRQFLRRTSPAVRTQLRRGLRRPWPGLPVAAFGLAAVLLALGAVLSALDAVTAVGVLLVAVAVRVGLGVQARRAGIAASPWRLRSV